MITNTHTLKSARQIIDNAEKSGIIHEDGVTPMSGNAAQKITPEQVLSNRIDWSQCPAVVRTAGVVSGQWRIKGTRIPVSALIDNYNAGYSADAMATSIFVGLPISLACEVIKYAAERG